VDKCGQIVAYTDDVVFMGKRLQDFEEEFTSFIMQTNKVG
jgi:hypothetical protein